MMFQILGEHPSGLCVQIRETEIGFFYTARYDCGVSRSLDVAKRCAVMDSFPEEHSFRSLHEEMSVWTWKTHQIETPSHLNLHFRIPTFQNEKA